MMAGRTWPAGRSLATTDLLDKPNYIFCHQNLAVNTSGGSKEVYMNDVIHRNIMHILIWNKCAIINCFRGDIGLYIYTVYTY